MKYCFLILFSIGLINLCEIEAQLEPKYTLGFDVKIPRITSNKGFKSTMFGIGDMDLYFNFFLHKSISIGIDYKYAYYQLNNKLFQNQINGQIENHFAGLGLFYINEISETTYAKFGLRSGYNYLISSVSNLGAEKVNELAFGIEPMIGFFLNNSSFGSVGLIFSYNMWNTSFRPETIGATQISGLNNNDFIGSNRIFSVGLSYEKLFGYR